jgi:hypothetical protein
MKKLFLILFALFACTPPPSQEEVDKATCTEICTPNLPLRIARSLGKIECECDVLTDGGIVRDGGRRCGGRAVRRVSATAFGEDVECAR